MGVQIEDLDAVARRVHRGCSGAFVGDGSCGLKGWVYGRCLRRVRGCVTLLLLTLSVLRGNRAGCFGWGGGLCGCPRLVRVGRDVDGYVEALV